MRVWESCHKSCQKMVVQISFLFKDMSSGHTKVHFCGNYLPSEHAGNSKIWHDLINMSY